VRFAQIFRIQEGEGRLVALVVGMMFVASAALTIGESGIDALFFNKVGAQALPVMYLLQGAAAFLAMLVLTGILGRLGPRRAYLGAPLALAAAVLGGRLLLVLGAGWVYRLLWIIVTLAFLVQGIALWGTAGAVVDTRQAKRLFPIFGAGSILGVVVGGLVTRPLASSIGTDNLLFVWVGGLAAVFVLCRMILGRAPRVGRRPSHRQEASAVRDLARTFGSVRRSRLLVWMTVAAVLFSVLFFTLYLPYARAAAAHFPDPAKLAGFFGLFDAAATGAAFLVSVFATNKLFLRFGTAAMVIVLPLLYTGAFAVMLVQSGFVTLVALRFAVGTWLEGVASPGWEALINVVPERRRDQTRAFMHGGATQVGTVIAGVLALVGQNALTFRQFALIGLGAALLTVVAAIGVRRSYAGALVDALREGRPEVFEGPAVRQFPIELPFDGDSARVLGRSLRSPDVRERRLAFQLLASMPAEARPAEAADGAADDDPLVRLAAVPLLDVSTKTGEEKLLSMAGDPDPAVAAAAAARALAVPDGGRPESRMCELLAHGDHRVRRTALEQLALAPPAKAAELAAEALDDPDTEVRAAALERLAATAPDRAFDIAVRDLRDPDPTVRLAAGRALGGAQGRGVDQVLEALQSPQTADGAVEAIRRLELDGDRNRVRAFIRSAADLARRDRELAASIPSDDETARLLHDAVLGRGRAVARSALWAATMLAGRRAEMETAIENLDSPPDQMATALETLEAAGDPGLVRPLLALWEPAAPPPHREDWLSLAHSDDDEFIKRCADLVRATRQGDHMAGTVAALSTIERVLFLRNVSLFTGLSPQDLERVALLTEERGFADGEVIASEGELGDELYIVIDGTIRVVQDRGSTENELARRAAGDVVGEMSLITQSPRIASLVADGAVRTIRLGRREFESMLRERPGIAMAVMRVLANRLAEDASRHREGGQEV
jgi:Cyclic nucleotide-binding domain/HEAT repeats/TLC ATP/ADP transporter